MKSLAITLIALGTICTGKQVVANVPETSETVSIHAVMFELEYDTGGNIRHAQAMGGYPSLETCQTVMPKLMGFIGTQIEKGLQAQLLCSGVRLKKPPDTAL